MSVLIRNDENDKIANIYGPFMNKKDLMKVNKGDKLDILCSDGLNYMVDVIEIDFNMNTISLHFIKWSKKFDFTGPLSSLYLAKLHEYSSGISPMNKYSPSLQTGEEKKTTIKSPTSNPSVRGSLESTTRYPDDFLQKPRHTQISNAIGIKYKKRMPEWNNRNFKDKDENIEDNNDDDDDDDDSDSKNSRRRTRTTFFVHQEPNPEKDGLASSGRKRNKDDALINDTNNNYVNKELDKNIISVKKKKNDKVPISNISESSILEHQLFTFNSNDSINDTTNDDSNNNDFNQIIDKKNDFTKIESPILFNELTSNSITEKELKLLSIFQESLQFNKSITLNKFCIDALLQIQRGPEKKFCLVNQSKLQKLSELLKARRNIESVISSLIDM